MKTFFRKPIVVFLLRLTFSIILLALIINRIDIELVKDEISRSNYWLFIGAVGITFFAWLINVVKWRRIILTMTDSPLSFWRLLALNFISYFYATALPGGLLIGEIAKGYRLLRNEKDKARLALSIVLDRLTGFWGIMILGVGALVWPVTRVSPSLQWQLLLWLVVLLAGSLLSMIFFWKPALLRILLAIPFLSDRIWYRVIIQKIEDALLFYRGNHRPMIVVVVLAVVFQLVSSLSLFLLSLSLGLPISLLELIWVYAIVSILLFIPITVAGFGIREGSFLYFFSLLGILPEKALGFAALVFAVQLIFALIGFLVLVFSRK